jgi:large subunit ribosomal protein L10
MPNLVNQMIVREMTDDLKESAGMVVVSFDGLDVQLTEDVRNKLAEKGASLHMVRNNLMRVVLNEQGIQIGDDVLQGNVAIALGSTEAILGAAKVLNEPDLRKTKKVRFKAGMLDGEMLDAAGAQAMADVPDRDTLNSMLLGVISGPARYLATVLDALPTSTARVVQARADQLEANGPAPEPAAAEAAAPEAAPEEAAPVEAAPEEAASEEAAAPDESTEAENKTDPEDSDS